MRARSPPVTRPNPGTVVPDPSRSSRPTSPARRNGDFDQNNPYDAGQGQGSLNPCGHLAGCACFKCGSMRTPGRSCTPRQKAHGITPPPVLISDGNKPGQPFFTVAFDQVGIA